MPAANLDGRRGGHRGLVRLRKAQNLPTGHTLCLIYWGAGLMWLVDFFFEYFSEGAAYFQQSFSEILNDSLLGLSAVTLGAIAWLAILLVKDPKRVFKQQ